MCKEKTMQKVRIRRGNVILRVDELDVQRYLNMGYDVTDDHGNIVKAAVPTDYGTLRKLYVENTEKIKLLEEQIADLTKKLMDAEAKKPAPKKKTTKAAEKE